MLFCPSIYQHLIALTALCFLRINCTSRPSIVVNARSDTPPLFRRARQSDDNSNEQNGLTLGDLDAMEAAKESNGFYENFTPMRHGYFDSQQYTDQKDSAAEEQKQPKRSLRRINLDLSGRIMCHVFSPSNDDADTTTTPLFCFRGEVDASNNAPCLHSVKRFIPRIYAGSFYDLDEIWFGATRWIAKCSWGPISPLDGISQHLFASRARNIAAKLFATNSFSSMSNWVVDLEGEQSVFDPADTTVRISLVQSLPPIQSPNDFQCRPQKMTLEYDSAKYFEDYYYTFNYKSSPRHLQYSPTMKLDIQTSLFHPRLEFHSKHTWVIKEGGDNIGNYYSGAHFGSESPAERRVQQIKAKYRQDIPQYSQFAHRADGSHKSSIRAARSKLSAWLENDGWLPDKVTTNLLGNLVSVNNFGFGNNMGLRIRVSKRIDWSKLGIFPWSNNSYDRLGEKAYVGRQAAKVRIELCRLNSSDDTRTWAAIDADPLDVLNTFKIVAGQESLHCKSKD
ncbi:hypothetical protein ACHAXN_004221 [Cyclotella atomus]